MAVIVKDSRNRPPFWYACFTTADGRRLKKSTKETNLAKAKIIAETLQRAEDMAAASRTVLSANATSKDAAFTVTAFTHCGIPSRTITSLKKSGCD